MAVETTLSGKFSAQPWATALVDSLARLAVDARVFALTVAFAASLFWIVPRPLMTDLPQHIAQIGMWHDMLLGQFAWADLFRINLLTPYITGYVLALGLSFVVSATVAVKLVVTAAFVAFVISCVQLARDFGADRRLDWLTIPGFFGFACEWGFLPFLVAAPIGIQFIRLALRHARGRTLKLDVGIVALGTLLLFSHGLTFLFAGLIGGLLLLASARSLKDFARGALPYCGLAAVLIAYFVASRSLEASAEFTEVNWWAGPLMRIPAALIFIQSASSETFLPLTTILIAVPLLLGLRFSRFAAIPLVVVVVIMLCVPRTAYATDFLFERFAMFLLPFLALTFGPPLTADPNPIRSRLCVVALMLACWGGIAIHARQALAFTHENLDFERVLAAAEPGRRAATLVLDLASEAADHASIAQYQPTWYQIEKKGLVEFNFAKFHTQVVRYRAEHIPNDGFAFNGHAVPFDWSLPQARFYDYFFVRQKGANLPRTFADSPACELRLVKASGAWSLFERVTCKP